MSITTTPHLNFAGNAREALEFYATVFGGEVVASTYGQFGMPQEAPDASKIVFGSVESADGFHVMAYDVPSGSTPLAGSTRREHGMTISDQPTFVSVRGASLDEVKRYWDGLAAGATVLESLAPSAWSEGFGMLTDRFGVTWILDVQGV